MAKKLIVFALVFIFTVAGFSQQKLASIPPSLGNLHLIWPMCDGDSKNIHITSPYGYRDDVKLPDRGGAEDSIHFAIDMIPLVGDPARTKIIAAEEGVAVNVYPAPSGRFKGNRVFGGCVEIRHILGVVGEKTLYVYTFYAHMKEVWVKEGQKVKRGEAIGLMGSTGDSTGPHLHFELRIDPLDFLSLSDQMNEETQNAMIEQQEKEYLAWRNRR